MNKQSHRPRPVRNRCVALAAVVALAAPATVAPAAHAGPYPMYAGDVPGINLPAPSQAAWSFYDTSGMIQRWNEFATKTKGASAWWNINYPTGVLAQNTGVGMTLTIPSSGPKAAVSIARVTDWSETALTPQNLHGANEPPALAVGLAPSISAAPGGSASGWNGTTTSGPGHDSGALPAGTTSRSLGVFCAFYGGGYSNCTLPTPFLRIRGLKTVLQEGVQPTAAIDGGGLTLTGPLKGNKTVQYTAGDDESGVEKIEVTLDGAVVATQSLARDLTLAADQQTGDCSYVALAACPATRSDVITVDTTKVPDGAYELGLRVTDAAGNTRTALAGQPAVIDNVPDAPAPSSPTPVTPATPGRDGTNGPGGPSGAGGTNGASVVLHLNGANATAAASIKATFASSRRGTIKSAYGKKVLITGQLVSPSGTPISAARVTVMQQDKMVGAQMTPAAELTTDAAGRFRYVTTAVRSRTIRFGYRAHIEDTAFAQTTDIGLQVVAKVALSTTRRSLRNGQTVGFRGSVAGAPANARKVVELQVKRGARWMTFRSTRLRKGRFSEKYRFTSTQGVRTYVFRARVREEAGFPFLTGFSKQVKVTVRG